MKKKYIWIIIGLLAVGGGYYWYSKTYSSVKPVQYKTAAAEKGILTMSVSASGNVIVDQVANIDPTITGTVANLSVKIGDSVKKDQLLFNIVNDQLGVSAAKAGVSYAQAKKSIDDAKYSKKQAEAEYKDNSKKILKDKVALADEAVIIAEQNLAAVQKDYQNQLSNAAKRNVTAPIDGTVNAVNIKNGDDLSKLSSGSSRQVPMIIGDLSTMKAQVQVNEIDIPNVDIGQEATLKFAAIDDLNVSGKVEKVDALGVIAQGVVIYNVTIGFDAIDFRIKPEMSVSAAIITGVKQNVIIIPNSAVKSQGNDYFVEILNGQSQIPQQKSIEIGAANNMNTEIISGVNAGDKVVTQTINSNATAASSSDNIKIPGVGGGLGR